MLDRERAYQDKMFGTEFDKQNSIGDWIIYIEEYMSKAKKKFFGSRILCRTRPCSNRNFLVPGQFLNQRYLPGSRSPKPISYAGHAV